MVSPSGMRAWLGVGLLLVIGVIVWIGLRRRPRDLVHAPHVEARNVDVEAPSARSTPVWREVDPVGTLRLEGQVIDGDEHPVSGALVTLAAWPPRNTRTEADGSFAFDKLSPRAYELEARTDVLHAGPVETTLRGAR